MPGAPPPTWACRLPYLHGPPREAHYSAQRADTADFLIPDWDSVLWLGSGFFLSFFPSLSLPLSFPSFFLFKPKQSVAEALEISSSCFNGFGAGGVPWSVVQTCIYRPLLKIAAFEIPRAPNLLPEVRLCHQSCCCISICLAGDC